MAELITEEQPRIKYALRRRGSWALGAADASPELAALCALVGRMEAAGAAPVLNDGKVGGNCAITAAAAVAGGSDASSSGRGSDAGAAAAAAAAGGTPAAAAAAAAGAPGDGSVLVSRSGKAPGAALTASDFVRLLSYDTAAWAAEYASASDAAQPTSDAPLLWACLRPGAAAAYGWGAAPRVALHGHALEAGAGLEAARRHGIPVSEHETLFSTPADLAELEALFRSHPYPQHNIYIRRGHGFFVLGQSVADAAAAFERVGAIMAEAAASLHS